ncbi:MAG TPA: riboflavin kinase, partial [Flavisolibacter sp.]|nr:riboflavin kinase [Flavisolibacter sp.]
EGRKGNFSLLQEQQELWGYRLLEIPKHLLDEVSVSSTKIRSALLNGDVATANRLLGAPFSFRGLVVQGDQIGRTLGFPTANLVYEDEDKIHLGEGVYAVSVMLNGERKGAMLSIGKRPTLNDVIERVEVNIFDFDGNLYGTRLVVSVHSFIRGQEKYHSLEALKEQIQKDKERALELLLPSFESS